MSSDSVAVIEAIKAIRPMAVVYAPAAWDTLLAALAALTPSAPAYWCETCQANCRPASALASQAAVAPAQAGEVFAYTRFDDFILAKHWTGDSPPKDWTPLYTTPQPAQPSEQDGVFWRDGAPKKPWSSEWFIAVTTDGDRVVLRELPEEYTYDFTTADATYFMRPKVKKWAQFPDSQFNSPPTPPLAGQREDAVLWVDPRELLAVHEYGGLLIATSMAEPESNRTQPLFTRPASEAVDGVVVESNEPYLEPRWHTAHGADGRSFDVVFTKINGHQFVEAVYQLVGGGPTRGAPPIRRKVWPIASPSKAVRALLHGLGADARGRITALSQQAGGSDGR